MFGNENQESDWIDNTPKIRVVIRKRPISKKETAKSDVDIVDIRGPQTVVVREMKYQKQNKLTLDPKLTSPSTSKSITSISMLPSTKPTTTNQYHFMT
jgi:uncharacterized protein YcgI (DUF1989 family)